MKYRLPWFAFYVGDYCAATQHFKTEQDGAFLRIMMAMWGSGDCTVPNDMGTLRLITRLPPRRFQENIKPVLALLDVEGDKFTYPPLRTEYRKAVARILRQAAIGKSGGKARAAGASRCQGRFLPRSSGDLSSNNNAAHQTAHQPGTQDIHNHKIISISTATDSKSFIEKANDKLDNSVDAALDRYRTARGER